jgi:CheY-like chemotaxis protein
MNTTASLAYSLDTGYEPSVFDAKGQEFLPSNSLPMTPPCSPGSEYPPRPASVMSLNIPIPTFIMPPPKLLRPRSRGSFTSSSSGLSGGMRTLIVDDNPINLTILERTLRRYFSHLVAPDIAIATSGNEALCHMSPRILSPSDEYPPNLTTTNESSQSPFDLILLDIDMPDISGIQVAEQIRNVHRDQATAIVAVTTSIEPEQRRTYERVGMDGVVAKPIDLTILDRVVTRALLSRRGVVCRPRTSSVPPLPRDQSLRTFLLPELAGERLGKLCSATSSIQATESPFEIPLCRRSSFPLSLEELHLMQDGKSSTEVEPTKPEYEDELADSLAKTMLESTPAKMSYFGPEDSI